MPSNKFYLISFLFLLGVLGYLTYSIMSPFLFPIMWAAVFSIVFYPVYDFLLRHMKIKAVASGITILVIVIIIIGPFMYLSFMLLNELQNLISTINANRLDTLRELVQRFRDSAAVARITSYLGVRDLLSEEAVMSSVRTFGLKLLTDVPLRITNLLSAGLDFIFMIFTAFFLFRDGAETLISIKNYLPFREYQKERLAKQIKDIVISTVYGGVLVAVIQGILGGLAFFALGVSSPVLWGIAMSVMSFVPLLGTFIIWGPAVGYFLVQGAFLKGLGLFLFGIFGISMVDNVLKPLIIGSRTKMPTIIILFSVLGGIRIFGILGLIMGPLITAIFVSIFEIFRSIEEGETA